VAKQSQSMLVPFFFQGLVDHIAKSPGAQDPTDAWFQADRIHPLAKAHPFILQGVWPTLKNSMKD
jgi:acyl-CoA thioesterase-1